MHALPITITVSIHIISLTHIALISTRTFFIRLARVSSVSTTITAAVDVIVTVTVGTAVAVTRSQADRGPFRVGFGRFDDGGLGA
jgi:hypothetical protein